MLRFVIKVGIAGAAVHYINQEGVWKNSNESLKVYDKLNEQLAPYVKEIKAQVPLELPKIPKTGSLTQTAKEYWNLGVMSTFVLLSNLPNKVCSWTDSGINAIKPEVQKLMDSMSAPPPPKKS